MTNASVAMDQEEYNRQFAEYGACYNAIKEKRAAAEAEYARRNAKRGQIAEYLSHIRDQSLITSFNETLWYGTAKQVRVTMEGRLRFIFKGGQEVRVCIILCFGASGFMKEICNFKPLREIP